LSEACGGPSQIEKGDEEDLQDSGVKGGGQTGDQEGLKNETGAVSPKRAEVVINSAESPRKGKPQKSGGKGDLEGSEEVFPNDRTDEKGNQAESHPKDQIDPPKAGGVKKILT
jgi:hypothetical protein